MGCCSLNTGDTVVVVVYFQADGVVKYITIGSNGGLVVKPVGLVAIEDLGVMVLVVTTEGE